MRVALALSILLFGSGCAQLEFVDRGRVNHPAMDFNGALVPETNNYLTGMDVGKKGSSSEACSVCAH